MKISSKFATLALILLSSFLFGCERNNNLCSQDDGKAKTPIALTDLIASTTEPRLINNPELVEINGRMVEVNKLVDYPICNDDWSGIVYVGCDAQVAEADIDEGDNPLFFRGCDLNIDPGTVVYVAAHNDAVYYKGCSCHTGEDPIDLTNPQP